MTTSIFGPRTRFESHLQLFATLVRFAKRLKRLRSLQQKTESRKRDCIVDSEVTGKTRLRAEIKDVLASVVLMTCEVS